MRAGRLTACLLAALVASASAQERIRTALLPETVLESAATQYPSVIAALAARRGAVAGITTAEGAFDLVFGSDNFSYASGFYDGVALSAEAKQPLRAFGADVFAGYKISEGDFPTYEDVNFTNTGGAFKVGVLFSLLRDRDIDSRRVGLLNADIELRRADLELLLTRIGVQRGALIAYWNWVATGQQVKVYSDLLKIADERQSALQRQVDRGALAEIFLTENMQNITRRQQLLTVAERDLKLAANALSLYYRDERGQPLIPTPTELPEIPPSDALSAGELPAMTADIGTVLERRPELALLRATIDRERNRLALAENNLKPQLDVSLEVQDGRFGSIAEGGASRDSIDTVVGVTFSVPLQRRTEKGRINQARAELDEQQAKQQLAADQIAIELRELLIDLQASRELFQLALQEVDLSQKMRNAEVKRFQSGASDFFLVNVREETNADARVKLILAALAMRIARADYDAASVDVARLGLDPALLLAR